MDTPYLGEIRMFAGNYAPIGWALCNGAPLYIEDHTALYSLIGVTYGGDPGRFFLLPDLRSKLPLAPKGSAYQIGQVGGLDEIVLTREEIPSHTHSLVGATGTGSQASPAGNFLASSSVVSLYANETAEIPMAATAVGSEGFNENHSNWQPFLAINFIIALYGNHPPPPSE